MSKQVALDAMLQASEHAQTKPPVFLDAWKNGIHLAGTRFFNVDCDSVGQATSVDQLRPDLDMVFQVISSLSTYEQVFILSMCQFYCDSDVRAYCDKHSLTVPALPDIANLDDKHRSVIVTLLNSYTGW